MQEHRAKHPPEMEPTHPGEILREDILPALNLSVSEAARQLLVDGDAFALGDGVADSLRRGHHRLAVLLLAKRRPHLVEHAAGHAIGNNRL